MKSMDVRLSGISLSMRMSRRNVVSDLFVFPAVLEFIKVQYIFFKHQTAKLSFYAHRFKLDDQVNDLLLQTNFRRDVTAGTHC